MKKLFILLFLLQVFVANAYTQGCVIVRNISGFAHYNFKDHAFSMSEWVLDVNSRYFKSFRDFKGGEDQKTAVSDRSINRVFTFDITASRILKNGWSLSFNLPLTSNDRSTTIEHGGAGKPRHSTKSFGIGDIRLIAYKWVIKPAIRQKGNIQLGLGLKFPTGNYQYQDYFYRKEDSAVLAPVNPSIQLGDGGTGIITELNSYYILNEVLSLYSNFYYLINPREQNGTSPLLGRFPTPVQIKNGSTVNSVPDQYTIRGGVNGSFNRLITSVGIRAEGIPVHDLVGGSDGNRRAGYNISIEPGVIYNFKKTSVIFYLPVMIKRATKQTVPDKVASEQTGSYTLLQGGFADYLIFIGASFKL
ncbi:MAG TPA: hypothetical protein VGQ09_18745 [Chitinophagaceae bacterium]|jgi:hypothetical protein|nr:hypothetical protein [Chitinophagaceae bacterium]